MGQKATFPLVFTCSEANFSRRVFWAATRASSAHCLAIVASEDNTDRRSASFSVSLARCFEAMESKLARRASRDSALAEVSTLAFVGEVRESIGVLMSEEEQKTRRAF